MKTINLNIVRNFALIIALLCGNLTVLFGQSPPGNVGVNWVLVTFNQPPTTYTVTKAPLRYNKKMALSFHTDDGIADVFTVGFPFFTGIQVGNTNYPGLFYTDGCNHDVSFKLSSSVFSFNGVDGPDIHFPGNGYGVVTWPQLDSMYTANCAVYNHGINSNNSSDPAFINYSIKRNESYIRRQLYETTPGGVRTGLFVNPNGNINWSQPAFDLGYSGALNQSGQGILGNNGGDVNAIQWNQPYNIFRLQAEEINLLNIVAQMQTLSTNGANYWATVYTHSIINQYPLADFFSDFSAIASLYGKNGQDNLWMATEEEIINYLTVRDATTLNMGVAGNNLIIMFEGEIPSDQRFHPLTLLVNADATITNIQVNGGTNNTFTGIGQNNALINLEWEGTFIHPIVSLADSFVSIAEETGTQFDCWIAMDYVMMVPTGAEQNELKIRLCGIPNVVYEDGFCDDCEFSLGPDSTICQGYCVVLSAPAGEGNTYLWSNDSTSQSITVCPMDTTTYWVQLTTSGNCIASDTITINVLPSPIFDLGDDMEVCIGDTIDLTGPEDEDFIYSWYVNGQLIQGADSSHISMIVTDTSSIRLDILTPNTCVATDSIMIFALPLPVVDLGDDITACSGDTISIHYPVEEGYSLMWFIDGEYTGITDTIFSFIPYDTLVVTLQLTNPFGCMGLDSLIFFPLPTPIFVFEDDFNGCIGQTYRFETNFEAGHIFQWYENDVLSDETTSYYDFLAQVTTELKLTVTAPSGCSFSDSVLITAVPSPFIIVEPPMTNICLGESVNLSLNVFGATGFSWWDGNTQFQRTVTPTAEDSTFAFWAMAVNSFGCIVRDTAFVRVNENPRVDIIIEGGISIVCPGDSIRLIAQNIGNLAFDKLIWNHQDTTTGLVMQKKVVVNQNGFMVVEVFSIDGCRHADSIFVMVKPLPEVLITPSAQEVCQGSPVTLVASGAINYVWSTGQSVPSIVVKPQETTSYWVDGTSDQGCTSRDSVFIATIPVTPVTLSGIYPVYCLNDQPGTLYGDPEGGVFSGPGVNDNIFNPLIAGDGVHEVIYYYLNDFGCSNSDTATVFVFGGNTPIDLGLTDTLICPQDILELDAGPGFSQYFWSTGDTTQQILVWGFDYVAGTSRSISVVGVLSGCTAFGSVTVGIRTDCFTQITETNIPDVVITPNPNSGDFQLTLNEDSGPLIMRIFDSHGSLIQSQWFDSCSGKTASCTVSLGLNKTGLYLVTITTRNGHHVQKMIVR
ncbi:MAG: T9SS type A sorting domain-containing protein [Bacteroidales bacterium]|nr:T9SS type A sorting domain-containing protein [Bacteroidales bacterium]